MGVTIRNWNGFTAPIGELSTQALGLTAQGRATLTGLSETLSNRFSIYPPATDSSTLFFRENEGNDLLRLNGRFTGLSGRITEMSYFDDVVYDGTEPVSGEFYRLTRGVARYNEEVGFSGYFGKVEFEDFSEDYRATLWGKFCVATGAGSFHTADFRSADGAGYRFTGTVRMNTDDGPTFTGTLRSLDIYGEGGERIATARGMRLDAADFGDGGASFNDELIFARSDNVTLGNGGVYFKAWAGNDRVRGGTLGDTIEGGDGRDVLTGGAGEDVFRFSASEVVTDSFGRDLITDFGASDDLLLFDLAVFTALNNVDYFDDVTGDFLFDEAAADGVLTYVRGVVRYDADGSAGDDPAAIVVTLSGKPALGNSNFAAEAFTPL